MGCLLPCSPENKPPSKIGWSPLPSLTLKFLHRYMYFGLIDKLAPLPHTYIPPSNYCAQLNQEESFVHVVALFLKLLCYYGTSNLEKIHMSLSKCFCFPFKMYTHWSTSLTADRCLLPSTWQVISLPLYWRKTTTTKSVPWYMTDDGVILQHSNCRWITIVFVSAAPQVPTRGDQTSL